MMGTWGFWDFAREKWGISPEMESSPGGFTMAFPMKKKGERQISKDWMDCAPMDRSLMSVFQISNEPIGNKNHVHSRLPEIQCKNRLFRRKTWKNTCAMDKTWVVLR